MRFSNYTYFKYTTFIYIHKQTKHTMPNIYAMYIIYNVIETFITYTYKNLSINLLLKDVNWSIYTPQYGNKVNKPTQQQLKYKMCFSKINH